MFKSNYELFVLNINFFNYFLHHFNFIVYLAITIEKTIVLYTLSKVDALNWIRKSEVNKITVFLLMSVL